MCHHNHDLQGLVTQCLNAQDEIAKTLLQWGFFLKKRHTHFKDFCTTIPRPNICRVQKATDDLSLPSVRGSTRNNVNDAATSFACRNR